MLNLDAAKRLLCLAGIASIAACGGGGLSTPPPAHGSATPTPTPVPTSTPTASPTATPTPSPTPAPVVVAPNAMNFTSLGSSQTGNVSEASYTGAFTQTNTCTGIATISALTADTKSGYDFNVTSQTGGTCTVTFADAANRQGSLSITVTSANIVIMGKRAH